MTSGGTTPLLQLADVDYKYPGAREWTLKGVHFDVFPGEFIAVVGENGSGKSTFARLLNGLLEPTAGNVLWKGRPARGTAALRHLRRRVGFVFQNADNQFVRGTVEDDVAFGPENFGVDAAEVERRVEDALEAVGLLWARRRPVASLSGGERQLAAIAGVLALDPECLVLDEATSMLDPAGRRLLWHVLRQLAARRSLAAVVITHRAEETLAAGRVFALEGGRVAFFGPPRRLWRQPDLVHRLGLERPGIVRLQDELRRHGVDFGDDLFADVAGLVDALCRSS